MKKTVLILAGLLMAAGCATSPPAKIETVVFYPPLPQRPRLQFLTAITGEEDLSRKRGGFKDFLLGPALEDKSIGKAYDVAAVKGKIYVLDRRVGKLRILDLANGTFDTLNDQRMGTLSDPSGIWVTADETKYVGDIRRRQVVVFDRDNAYLRAYGGPEVFAKPVDVAVFGDTVYVCDMDKHQVLALDRASGELKMAIGGLGTGEGDFYRPSHVVVDQSGNLFVNDAFNFRVQKFNPRGQFIRSFGRLGDNLGAFARPKGIDIDREGHLYVADAAFENVQIFDEETGRLMLFFGGPGTRPGNMYLPFGVHIDYDNVEYFNRYADSDFRLKYVLYVGNYYGPNKLNVYGFGDWVGEKLSGENNRAVGLKSEVAKAE